MSELWQMTDEVLIDGLAGSAGDLEKAAFIDYAAEIFSRIGLATGGCFTESDVDTVRKMLVLANKLGEIDFSLIKGSAPSKKLWREYVELKEKLLARMKKNDSV